MGQTQEFVLEERLLGDSALMRKLREEMMIVARASEPVLISGETGTGKELVARGLHALNGRGDRPLVVLNVATIPGELTESELFGHKKGSFTGAYVDRDGAFLEADEGTLFLDEIGEMPLSLQSKLLRVLEQGEVRRVGESAVTTVDVRVIAATNRDLGIAVRTGTFRADLYYRLNAIPLTVPPLRERRDDIPLLARAFLAQKGEKIYLTQDATTLLMEHDWPGNVRELKHAVSRAALLTRHATVDEQSLAFLARQRAEPCSAAPGPEDGAPFPSFAEHRRRYFELLVECHPGVHQRELARFAGLSVRTLNVALRDYGLST